MKQGRLKAKALDSVRSDVPAVSDVVAKTNNSEETQVQINFRIPISQRKLWKKHIVDYNYKDLRQFLIESVNARIERDIKAGGLD